MVVVERVGKDVSHISVYTRAHTHTHLHHCLLNAAVPSWPVRHFFIGDGVAVLVGGGGVQTQKGMERDDVTASCKALCELSLHGSASTRGVLPKASGSRSDFH